LRNICIATTLGFLLLGCATVVTESGPIHVPVKIYDVENGDVFVGSYAWTGRHGSVSAMMGGGSQCAGEYLTVASGSSGNSAAWGTIYSLGNGLSGSPVSVGTVGSYATMQNSERGSAILRCADRNVLECEYVVNLDSHGSGYCRDTKSRKYKLIF